MEVDERPTEQYSDIGGLDKQIQEVKPFFLELKKCHLLVSYLSFEYRYFLFFLLRLFTLEKFSVQI